MSQAAYSAAFRDYWRSGKAEVNRFALEQGRYGELHPGEALLIFVTEDFHTGAQVKSESATAAGVVPILKANLVRAFATGIYRYATLTSVFTPLSAAPTLKVSTSVQEWCGHTYLQVNRRGHDLVVTRHSYFEGEGDSSFRLPDALLEDDVWARIRLDPATLATGEIRIVPGTLMARFSHRQPAVENARASLLARGDGLRRYLLEYPAARRTLTIDFRGAFPHEIVAFEESHAEGTRTLRSRATRTHSMLVDYWNKHSQRDLELRKRLGLN